MEENKNVELGLTQNNVETIQEEAYSIEQEQLDSDFVDIDKEEMKKNYIIISVLYFVVVILFILLVIGIKKQKDTVKDKIDSEKEINEKAQEKNEEIIIPEVEENIIPDSNNSNELNILDQV